jgi:3-oxoacyl-[acyl-carrier protein] reductase
MRVVVITGATGGLGRELAITFGCNGDHTVIHFHSRQQQAEEIANRIRTAGSKTLVVQAALLDRLSVQEMATGIFKKWGRIDVWINNAGITLDSLTENIPEKEWNLVIETNLHGAFYGVQEAARVMIRQQQGHIINVCSLVGLRGGVGQAAYSASKAGLIGLTKTTAKELGQFNIQANAVLPGYLSTSMTQKLSSKRMTQIIQENVLSRASEVSEIARFILHLSTMKHVSGQVFNLDSRIF